MAEFLSPEWFDEANRAARGHPGTPGEASIGVVVTGGPGGDVAYTLISGPGGVSLVRGGAEATRPPDVTLVQDYETAREIAAGHLAARSALLAGRLKVSGDLRALASSLDVLAAIVWPGQVRSEAD